MKRQGAAGADLDQFRNGIAVAGLGFEKREDQELGAALFPLGIGFRIRISHISGSNISTLASGAY